MRFLVDAQLPRRMAGWLRDAGHDAAHTFDLPSGNASTDTEVIDHAMRQERIVVSKDADFVESFLVKGVPPRLWLIATGNIDNTRLEALIRGHLDRVVRAFETSNFVELTQDALVVHE
jgi:predicted nuclease of predicted toxin-antitoxin system